MFRIDKDPGEINRAPLPVGLTLNRPQSDYITGSCDRLTPRVFA